MSPSRTGIAYFPFHYGRVPPWLFDRMVSWFEGLLGLPGVGARIIRALSLISELVYGIAPSYRDPARYSFAHGGKDGIPYPVDRNTYDRSIELMRKAINRAKMGLREKNEAIARLGGLPP